MKNFLSGAFFFACLVLSRAAPADDEVDALKQQVGQLQDRVQQLEQAKPPARAGGTYMNTSFDVLLDGGWSSDEEPSERLQLGDHDPQQRGFSLRNAELAVDGAVDPYFKGFGNIVLKLDEENESEIELEEAYLLSTAIPANLQAKAGQFFAEFGRQNSQHPHTWSFVDQPLILNRVFGGEGLRNVGARVSWLAPTPFYTEFMVGMFNGIGGTSSSFQNDEADFHGRVPVDRKLQGLDDFLFVPRLVSSFDLTAEQTLVLGASAAFGPNNSGEESDTQIYGGDVYWKWKPANADAGFPFVSWQTEILSRRYEAGEGVAEADETVVLPAETLDDWGFYSQLLWGFRPRWVCGFRGEYVEANDGSFADDGVVRGDRTRVSPVLTFFPSEFSKLRLQYNHDDLEEGGTEDSVWLQAEFTLGAHAAHKF